MSLPRVATAALLLAASAGLAARSDATRASPRPPPGPASLLGGFSAIAVQVLQMRVDVALREHRTADALLLFQLITELEPHLVDVAGSIARELGQNLAKEQADPEASWELANAGLMVLDRCVEANPGDPEALFERGKYLRYVICESPEMRPQFNRDRGIDPALAALSDFRAVLALDPAHGPALADLGGIDIGLVRGAYPEVGPDDLERAREAAAAYGELERLLRESGAFEGWQLNHMPALAREVVRLLEAPPAERPAAEAAFRERYPGWLPPAPEPPR